MTRTEELTDFVCAADRRAEDQISGIEQHRDEAARQGLTE